MTRLILFFKNIHAQNIYKLSSVSIHFSSDIHDVETSFFTQKNKYRYLANSGNTVFSGEAKNTITSLNWFLGNILHSFHSF